MRLGGNRRWVPLILAWYQAPQWAKRATNGVRNEKYGRAKQAQRSPRGDHPFSSQDYLSVRFARLFFLPMGSLVPGLNMNS